MHLRRTEPSAPQRAQGRRTLRARFDRIASRGPTCALGSSPPEPFWRDTAAIPQPTVPLHPWHELYRTPVATECLPNPTQHAEAPHHQSLPNIQDLHNNGTSILAEVHINGVGNFTSPSD